MRDLRNCVSHGHGSSIILYSHYVSAYPRVCISSRCYASVHSAASSTVGGYCRLRLHFRAAEHHLPSRSGRGPAQRRPKRVWAARAEPLDKSDTIRTAERPTTQNAIPRSNSEACRDRTRPARQCRRNHLARGFAVEAQPTWTRDPLGRHRRTSHMLRAGA